MTVQHDIKIDFDLETTPLEIKTDSAFGSNEIFQVYFFSESETRIGGIKIHLSSSPRYRIAKCSEQSKGFETNLSPETTKIWRISLFKKNLPEIRVIVHCNDEEVLNLELSDDLCDKYPNDWRKLWGTDVAMIKFEPSPNTSSYSAADYYRAYTQGNN